MFDDAKPRCTLDMAFATLCPTRSLLLSHASHNMARRDAIRRCECARECISRSSLGRGVVVSVAGVVVEEEEEEEEVVSAKGSSSEGRESAIWHA